MSKTGKYVAGANALLGAWLVVSVLVAFETEPAHFWNDVLVGGAVIVLATYNFAASGEYASVSVVASFVTALVGAWQVVAAVNFASLGATADLLFWSDAITGGLVLVLGAYNVYQGRFVSLDEEAEEAEETG
ncbi:SPW repeat protein [Halorussus sp. MSC15.2]|uniref:SPW repeat domain-containing protein n=1 Tax=Halorussus sp. MSC15.2 TaxID=2283638 RepID=UPI0013D5D98F|nr:SPW repeat protein [Halorussus sp. MSC15.2]NEU56430.1 hypothetical protein [Halorussus sp. MSC15.2]